MNPKMLQAVFTWQTRKVLIRDRVFYFPDYHDESEFLFPGWQSPELFGNDRQVKVEYCSGNGSWIAEKALLHPECNWVAVERQYKRVRKIWSKIKNLKLSNLIVVCGEGCAFTKKYIPTASLQEVFVNFPDPWPKARHAKHRIISPAFAEEMLRVVHAGGTITTVTDDPDYSSIMVQVFQAVSGFKSLNTPTHYTVELPGYGSSYFDSLWREKGREIRFHQFERVA